MDSTVTLNSSNQRSDLYEAEISWNIPRFTFHQRYSKSFQLDLPEIELKLKFVVEIQPQGSYNRCSLPVYKFIINDNSQSDKYHLTHMIVIRNKFGNLIDAHSYSTLLLDRWCRSKVFINDGNLCLRDKQLTILFDVRIKRAQHNDEELNESKFLKDLDILPEPTIADDIAVVGGIASVDPIDEEKLEIEAFAAGADEGEPAVFEDYPIATDVDSMTSRDFYFDHRAQIVVHEGMLRDEGRVLSYRNAMYQNKHLFKGKTVLDVGSGTGILSMFAAKAGAARVFAIESSNIADYSREIIKANNLDHIITLLKGKVEEVTLPGADKVDIILSEWRDYPSFFESTLDNVLFARDKWLDKKNGVMFPDRFTLSMTAIEDRQYKDEKINWWDDVYGFNMGIIRKAAITKPFVDVVDPKQVVTDSFLVKAIDLYSVKKAGLSFQSPFHLTVRRNDFITALITFFNVEFTKCQEHVEFSTSPESQYTHRKQTIFYLDEHITAKEGEKVFGTFSMHPSNPYLDFEIKIQFNGELSSISEENNYQME